MGKKYKQQTQLQLWTPRAQAHYLIHTDYTTQFFLAVDTYLDTIRLFITMRLLCVIALCIMTDWLSQ